MIKSFIDGLASKAGETLGVWLWPTLFAVAVSLWVWLGRPDTLQLSRAALLLLGGVAVILSLLSYTAGFFIAKYRYAPTVPKVDSLQLKVLCLLWLLPQNSAAFSDVGYLTGASPSDLTLAGERLQEQGLIAYFPIDFNSVMQLLKEGREYIKTTGLDVMAERQRLDVLESLKKLRST
jgi:hypothetical protein